MKKMMGRSTQGQRDRASRKATTKTDVTVTPKDENYFESPESSQVFGAHYQPETHTLYVVFKSKTGGDGPMYRYEGYPQSMWEAFKHSVSKGEFVNKQIIGDRKAPNYVGVKVQG